MTKRKKKTTTSFSLIQPTAMGGIHGGDGYSYQDRYIVCNIPRWIFDPTFIKLMPEGTGDVDVVFKDGKRHVFDHIQVKDHEVSLAEFRVVIETFVKIDKGTRKIYRKFTLAARSLSREVKSFFNALNRYQQAKELYTQEPKGLNSTKKDLKEKCEKIALKKYFPFIIEKLDIQVGKLDFNDNTACKQLFVSGLLEHPKYRQKVYEFVKPAYSTLIEQVLAHRGKVLSHQTIHSFIDSAIGSGRTEQPTAAVLHVHNWTLEKFEPNPSHTLDWTKLFDRQTRTVPDQDMWNKKLIPELQATRSEIAKTTPHRHVIFRGKTTLTTGLALGAIFAETGNWTVELLQPPQTAPWRTDADRVQNYKLDYQDLDPSFKGLQKSGNEIAVIFNITGKALDEVVNYFKNNSLAIAAIILIEPAKGSGNLSIKDDSEAVTLANAAKEILKAKLIKYNARRTHLFFYGPLGLAIFLGQKLTAVGEIQLYEFQDPGYKPSASIKT